MIPDGHIPRREAPIRSMQGDGVGFCCFFEKQFAKMILLLRKIH